MNLPALNETSASKTMISAFAGYNRNDVINDNEFYDMQNMSSDYYPVLAPRRKREVDNTFQNSCNGIFAKDYFCWADGTMFYVDYGSAGGLLTVSITNGPKRFAAMGAYILIWPDKKYVNTYTQETGSLENTWTAGQQSQPIQFSLAAWNADTQTSSDLGSYTTGGTAPQNPADGAYWCDTSAESDVLKRWSASQSEWISVPTTYVKIASAGIGSGFNRYDGVKISGCQNSYFNSTFIVYDVGADYLLVKGLIREAFTQNGGQSVSRSVPDMDFITESDNRLWGCSSANHEIYACKLGDPFNWNCFEGISTDSFAATIGSPGSFTGAVTYLGNVLFFKADCMHKVYGTQPKNFQIQCILMRGVDYGSEKSLCLVNETLYYKSRNGIMAYQGSMPTSISDALGSVHYKDAVAGTIGDKYYISMVDDDKLWHLFAYDTLRGLWYHEDNTHVLYFSYFGGMLYFIEASELRFYKISGGILDEPDFDWYVETGDWGDESPDHKYVSKLQVRMELDKGSTARVQIQIDSDGIWKTVYKLHATAKKTVTLPIIPRRCDHFRLKIGGKGMGKIYSIAKSLEDGSEL